MKDNGKSKAPIIAKNSNQEPAPPANKRKTGAKGRASQTTKQTTDGVKQAALERISDGILALDAGMNYTYLNERAGELLGISAGDLVGKNLREQFPGDERTSFMEACQRAIETQSVVWLNEYFPPTDRWLQGRIYPSRDGVSVLFSEGSSGSAEEERARMMAMFPEQNPAPVMRLTHDAKVLYANRAAASLLETWQNQTGSAVSFLKVQELLPEVIQSNTNQEIEIRHEGRVFSCQLVPFPGEGYVNLYFRDITERKQAEETLGAIVNQASAGIFRTDLQGRLIFVNQVFCDMLGTSEAGLTGMSIWEMIDEKSLGKNRRLFEHLLATGEGYQVETRLIRPNGSRIWVSVGNSALLDMDGRVQGATSVIVDISRRKRAEEYLLENARRSLFLSSLSDTIRSIDNPSKIQIEAACLLGAQLKASRVAYVEVEPDGSLLIQENYVDGVDEMTGRFSVADFIPEEQLYKFRARRAFITGDVQSDPRFSDSQKSAYETHSVQAQVVLPFTRGEKVVAGLLVQQSQARAWKDDEISLLEESAERTQAAIERARAEEQLRDSEKRFRILSNTVPSIVWTSAPDGRLLYVNDHWYDFTGPANRQEMPLWSDLKLHPEDARNFFQEVRAIKSEKSEAVMEVRIQRQDGVYRWFQTRSVPTMDENGKITAWHGVLTDIHDRVKKDAEQRKIIDSTPFMLARCSRDLRYLFVSRAYAEMFDLQPEQVIGKPIIEILGEEGLKTIRPYLERVLQGERLEYESRVSFPTGITPYLHVAYTPDWDEHGNVTGWFASIVDLTERKQIEEDLRESEHKFNIIFNKLPFTAILISPNDNIIMNVNEEFESVFGFSAREAIGRTTFELGIDSKPEERAHILAELQANVAIRDMELQLNTKSRGARTLLINTDMVNIGGSQYILQTSQDITERKQIEQSLAHEREMFKRLFETMPVMSTIYEPETGTMRMNAEIERLTGWKPEEVTVVSLLQALYPDPEYMKEVLGRMAAAVTTKEWVEIKIHARDGRILDTLWANTSLMDGEKIITGISLGIDITERKRAEEALHQLNLELEERVKRRTIELQLANEFLRESEATSRLILESMPDAIVIIDRNGKIVHANTQVETLFGHSPAEVIGLPVETLVPQRFQTDHELQRLSYGEVRNRHIMGLGKELFGRRKDESEFPVEVMLAPIESSTNWDVLVAIRDNTRQRQAQEALRNNEEKLRTLFEILPVGISFLNKEGEVSELNSALAEILEMPRNDIQAGNYGSRRFIRADGSPMPTSEFASTRAQQEQKTIYNVETGIVKENGEITWTSVNAAPVLVADIEAAIVTIDITERKKAEEALHKNRERLRILSRRLVEVQEDERHAIARELHDRVGQNLAALTLNLNILRNQLSGEVLDKVGTRLNDSVTLVKDILTITRSVMADLRPDVLDDYGLDAAINEYAERFTKRYGIRVITHTPEKPTPRLDPGVEMTLLRIAQEALTNIAKHARASQAIMTLEMEKDAALMSIEDNGQGILSWQKVNQPSSHGLRIMRERAEAFGGYLKINSTYKNGTKIEVKIPLANSLPGNGRKEKKS